ncbi:MAG: hypothetical protein UW46_C0006G0054 [Candidatus Yanofskybacteria bacterium GW2011_GWF1_44_227]|uniref:Uncharacterized protein n=1 Tax=Candidatus Yanofskybacteria bacterium GW2011_GWE2_40_11 TaxID=1619033 RepID=A0A0G0T044_9BACT|nr:MAG: hypothetical protein UT69_C0002G0048 [Candidatus Yanofskybacteria bacterium GW2011_GWE1_40_10]KKR40500.1 MAG: hypothetical protein UT75_C0008G0022 [Candidatus Yanofskybacteria bacterium GW2011_GWE2_40_11]KKT53153.1 MAG: hypothetical protein UW46_C0006G0054 [Candidatus Yanofskybacteria bacterium GW2011_GWF1_44_227]OGN35499.1 MAG: hypothetical protein A2207_02045 [Candidatus Yanofskybacteria bacterium RIFOXYA1_FULL_44_17]OGN36795.1 MAG: hypothetical protein A2241_03330 [Candidatus Yanofsk
MIRFDKTGRTVTIYQDDEYIGCIPHLNKNLVIGGVTISPADLRLVTRRLAFERGEVICDCCGEIAKFAEHRPAHDAYDCAACENRILVKREWATG